MPIEPGSFGFSTSDGIRLNVRRWEPVDPVPGLPPVVLHHGFLANGDINWKLPGLVDVLLEAGRTLVAPDARGHGSSDAPHDPASYGEPRMAQDLWELVDHLGFAVIDLVGYSMGAVVSLLAAAMRPDAVRRLVVGGVGASVVEQGGADRTIVSSQALERAMLFDDPAGIDPAAGGFRQFADAIGADRVAMAAQARASHRDGIDLEAVTMPALVVVGRRDPLATRPEVLVDALPDARLVTVNGDHRNVPGSPSFHRAVRDFLAGA